MTKGRENAAESMKDVLALIRSRHQSGVLSVERFENGVFEEGEIHFQSGRPVQGFVGTLTGDVALNHLLSWRRVYFAFTPTSTTTASSSAKDTSPVSNSPLPSFPPVRFAPQHLGPSTPSVTEPLRGDTDRRLPSQKRITGPLARQNDVATLIPRKISMYKDVMSLSLTRLQRSVYLLIDGQRTVADLARFTGKGIPEVVQIIVDLRARNLVSM